MKKVRAVSAAAIVSMIATLCVVSAAALATSTRARGRPYTLRIYVSVKQDASGEQLRALLRPLQAASERLYHATGGMIYIGRVLLRDRRTDGELAFSYRFNRTPHGARNIPMGPAHWWDRTLMHEIGHLKLALWDEYRRKPTCPRCVMALNSYGFCHKGKHRGHTRWRPDCWTRLRQFYRRLPRYAQRARTRGEHAPPIRARIVNTGQK